MWGSSNRLPVARPRATFDRIPVTVDLSPSGAETMGRFVAAILALAAGFYTQSQLGSLGNASESTSLSVITAVPLFFLGLGAVLAAWGGYALLSRRAARFDASSVSVTGRTPLGREEWSAPLSAFEGVAWRIVRKRRRRGSDRIYQVIELVHPDPARTLPVHVRQTKRDARAEWEGIARALGLPAIDNRDGSGHVRAAEDLDKSVRELAEEGKTRATWQPGSEPPAGLSWQSAGEGPAQALVVRLHARRFPLWLYAAASTMGLIFLAIGILDDAIAAMLIGAALAGGVIWYWLREPASPRELRISRDDIRLVDPMPLGQSSDPLRLDAIEEIRVARPRAGLGGGTLVIASDQGEIRTGHGLNAEALEWLRRYLTAAVVEA